MKWDLVWQPIAQGGLGICSIVKVKKALLEKWLWRVGEGGSCLWRHLVIHKYKLELGGWFLQGRDYKASGIWKSIPSMMGDSE